MNPEPEPRRDRKGPPPQLHVQVSGSEPSKRLLLLDLLDDAEARCFEQAFRLLGWYVMRYLSGATEAETILLGGPRATLVLTDDPSLKRRAAAAGLSPVPDFVVVTDNRESAYEGAYRAGADWVVLRPINPNDPLGMLAQ